MLKTPPSWKFMEGIPQHRLDLQLGAGFKKITVALFINFSVILITHLIKLIEI